MSTKVNKDIAKFNALIIAAMCLDKVDIESELGDFLVEESLDEFTPLIQDEVNRLTKSIMNRAEKLNAKYKYKIPDLANTSIETGLIENPIEPLY
ncbi:hypothetical protein [Photobacterium damselae]|uniref:hypothetical protein n=1 Tax=Photobacterium damselae TaxID=38293 RepID=UPI0040677A89